MTKILLIDDHRGSLATLSMLFRTVGYQSITVANLEQAEHAFSTENIDLVVLDHGVPGLNGGELAAHLKRIRPVQVLMLSGNPELSGKPNSVDLLLPKPIPPQELLKAVEGLLQQS